VERRIILIVVGALFALALLGTIAIMLRGESNLSGVPLSPEQRAEIDNADCAQLDALYARYAKGSGSVEADTTAIPRVQLRMQSLDCPKPTTSTTAG
jgi:hypothetical protein